MAPSSRPAQVNQLAIELRDAITRLNRRLRQTRPLGEVTVAQISALLSLDAAGALTPRELAEAERVQPPTMTRIVAKLEDRGLVQRTPHPTDGRQVVLAPSQAGRDMLDEYRRARDEWLAQRLGALTPEERETVHRAAEILNRLAKD
ncbi:MarR family transcriptional regulator [Luedemannella helvata]|uniref:MarR family transcriptional regulator n=1 Tax=Luedemannella helvata TaxID=349315 RepID=A0ABP4XCE0_9ACTN